MYANHTRKRQWVNANKEPQPEPNGDVHPCKTMLSVSWDVKGVMFELLPPNTIITAACNCDQLERLTQKLSMVQSGHLKVLFLTRECPVAYHKDDPIPALRPQMRDSVAPTVLSGPCSVGLIPFPDPA